MISSLTRSPYQDQGEIIDCLLVPCSKTGTSHRQPLPFARHKLRAASSELPIHPNWTAAALTTTATAGTRETGPIPAIKAAAGRRKPIIQQAYPATDFRAQYQAITTWYPTHQATILVLQRPRCDSGCLSPHGDRGGVDFVNCDVLCAACCVLLKGQ